MVNWPRAVRRRTAVVAELLQFLWRERLWWLIPFVLFLVVGTVVLVAAHSTPAAPLIYTLF